MSITFKQAKAILSKDIIERDQNGFVFQGNEGRIGWEKTLPKGSAYSDYLLKVNTVEEALKVAYRHASDMLVAMNLPKKVTIEVSQTEDSGWTDNKMICLTTKFFDNPALTVGQKMDIFTGLAVHEGAHVLYTNFLNREGLSEFASSLENVIEDERIEHRIGVEKPGLANFLQMTKWYFFGLYGKSVREDAALQNHDAAVRLVNAVISLIRYPGILGDEEIREFAEPLVEVHDCMIPYPDTPAEVKQKAIEVEAILLKYIKQPPKQSGDGQGENDEDSQGNESGNGGGSGSSQKQSGNKPDNKSDSGNTAGKESGKGGDKKDGKNDKGNAAGQGLPDKVAKDILSKMAGKMKIISRGSGDKLTGDDECEAVKCDPTLNKILSGKMEKTDYYGTVFCNVDPYEASASTYSLVLSSVRPHVAAMRNVLRANAVEERRTLTGMRSGLLDTNMLAQGFQGVQSIYKQFQTVEADPITVCLLVDESGSMHGNKMWKAAEAAVLIDEALKGIRGVNLFIYGFTSGEQAMAEIRIYRENGKNTPKNILGALAPRRGTPTGEAIAAVTDRVRSKTRDDVLLFVITDGDDGGRYGTRRAVRRAMQNGFAPVGIGIENSLDLSDDFPESLSLTDLSSLPKNLGKIVRKAILKNSQRHVA